MSDFLSGLRGQGQLESRGEFSLDVEQAQRKMSRFQLPHAHDFLYHLVAGLFRLGATRLDVYTQAAQLRIEMPPLSLPANLLEELSLAIFEESSPFRRLAAASQSLLGFELVRFDWIGAQSKQCYDYLAGQATKWSQVSLKQIQIEGIPRPVLDKALAELAQRGAWSRRPLRVEERRFQFPQGVEFKLGGFPSECEWRPGEKPQLLLIMDEIAAEMRVVEAPFAWTGICYGEFRLDVSLAQVVEDESVLQILQDIPNTFADCVRLGLANVSPEDILPLMGKPLPAWLEPLEARLFDLALFHDQHQRAWSLAELLKGSEPIYVAESGPEFKQLEPTIFMKPSAGALECLRSQLGPRLRQVDRLILRELQRQHNHRLWEAQRPQALALSLRHWLSQQEFEHKGTRWLVGIPDDWSQPGASVTLWVGGRKLAVSRLVLQEITCEIACEVSLEQVNDLWTGLEAGAWRELEPHWNRSIQEVLLSFAGGGQPQAEVRQYLKQHLAASAKPEDNYFRNTLLFEDWHGKFYSLDQLLHLDSSLQLGVVGPQYDPGRFVSPLIPDGVYLRDSGLERKILQKIRLLAFLILDVFLEDLLVAQKQAFTANSLEPRPDFGVATVQFCCAGLCLAPLALDWPFAFEARVCNDQLDVQTVLYNQALGTGRFKPADNERTQKALAEVQQRLGPTLEYRLQGALDEGWLEWLRQATLRKLCLGFLLDVPCWPCYPEGLVSLRQLNQAPVVYWCSGEGGSAPGLLLANLSPLVQSELEELSGENEWVCLDEAFACEREQKDFLQKPIWRALFTEMVDWRMPDLWLVASGFGRVFWLFKGRLIEDQVGAAPYGFRLAVECPSLLPEDRPQTGVAESCYGFLKEWLAVPRPPLWDHWQHWAQQGLPESILPLLQAQKWFATNRGARSWQELIEEPEIWLLSASSRRFPEDLLQVFDQHYLLLSHPNAHGVEDSLRKLAALDALEVQRKHAQGLSRRLERLPYRVKTEFGELALSGENAKNVWLLEGEREVLVENLPSGLVGYVQCPAEVRVQRNERPVAELSPEVRDLLMEQVAELVRARVASGPLKRAELELVSEVCRAVECLDGLRWIECADGSYASLQQLRQESQERGGLLYWSRNYFFRAGGPVLLPILPSPLMVDVVAQACACSPQLCPPPWLHREISLRGFRQALSGLAQVVERGSLLGGMRKLLAGPPPSVPEGEMGQALLESLRRRASQLLNGKAHSVCLAHLEAAELRPGLERLWEFQGNLRLRSDHPLLLPWLGSQEPPLNVQTSLLLSLVCAINAMSLPFTDEMEREFLENISGEIVDSLPR